MSQNKILFRGQRKAMIVACAVQIEPEFGFKLGEFTTYARKKLKPTSIDARTSFSLLLHFKEGNYTIDISHESITYYGFGYETWLKQKDAFFSLISEFAKQFDTESFQRLGFYVESYFQLDMTRKEISSLLHDSLLSTKESFPPNLGTIYDGQTVLWFEGEDYKHKTSITSMNHDDVWTTLSSNSRAITRLNKGMPQSVIEFFSQFERKKSVLNVNIDLFIEDWKFSNLDRIKDGYLENEADDLMNTLKKMIAP